MIKKILCFFGFHRVKKEYNWPVGYVHKTCERDGCKHHKVVKDEEGYYNHVINSN